MNAGLMNTILAFWIIYFFLEPNICYQLYRCCCKGYKKYKGDDFKKKRKDDKKSHKQKRKETKHGAKYQ